MEPADRRRPGAALSGNPSSGSAPGPGCTILRCSRETDAGSIRSCRLSPLPSTKTLPRLTATHSTADSCHGSRAPHTVRSAQDRHRAPYLFHGKPGHLTRGRPFHTGTMRLPPTADTGSLGYIRRYHRHPRAVPRQRLILAAGRCWKMLPAMWGSVRSAGPPGQGTLGNRVLGGDILHEAA